MRFALLKTALVSRASERSASVKLHSERSEPSRSAPNNEAWERSSAKTNWKRTRMAKSSSRGSLRSGSHYPVTVRLRPGWPRTDESVRLERRRFSLRMGRPSRRSCCGRKRNCGCPGRTSRTHTITALFRPYVRKPMRSAVVSRRRS